MAPKSVFGSGWYGFVDHEWTIIQINGASGWRVRFSVAFLKFLAIPMLPDGCYDIAAWAQEYRATRCKKSAQAKLARQTSGVECSSTSFGPASGICRQALAFTTMMQWHSFNVSVIPRWGMTLG